MAYAPQLTVFLTMDPCPRVEVLFPSLDPATERVTVYRSAGGREDRVQGAVLAPSAGAFVRMDNLPPFGVDVTYRAEMFDTSGVSLGFTSPSVTRVEFGRMVVQNPLDPRGAVVVEFRGNAARELSRPHEGNTFYPQGRTVGVVIAGQRRGLSGVVLDVVSDSDEATEKFAALTGGHGVATVPVLAFRKGGSDRVRIPPLLFVSVMDAREIVPENYAWGGTQVDFQITGDEVSPPAEGLVIPLLTRADVDAYYPTRQALDDDNPTRIGVSRRYDIVGAPPVDPEIVVEDLPPADDFFPELYEDPSDPGFYILGAV